VRPASKRRWRWRRSKAIEHWPKIAEQFDVHPNQTTWKTQLENGAADIFSPNSTATAQPAIDVKALHAKIRELTLENDS
jgi:transposase-like protein